MRMLLSAVFCLAVSTPTWANPNDPWQEPSFEYRVKIPIKGSLISGASYDTAVLVRLDPSWFPYNNNSSLGDDIRFHHIYDGQNDYEIELWEPGGESLVWVRVDRIVPNDSEYLWMYYGSTAGNQSNPLSTFGPGVWESVYHFSTHPYSDPFMDSGPYRNDLGQSTNPFRPLPDIGVAGVIGDGLYHSDGQAMEGQTEWDWLAFQFSVQVWMDGSGNGNRGRCDVTVGLTGDDNGPDRTPKIGCLDNGQRLGMEIDSAEVSTPFPISGQTHLYTFVWDGPELRLYVDDQQVDADCCATGSWFGYDYDDLVINEQDGWLGGIDEWRLTPQPLYANDVRVEYYAQTGDILEPCSSADYNVWFKDTDGDGFGDPSSATTTCIQPRDGVLVGGDCDDTNDTVNDGAAEVCGDGIDNDCDGDIDGDDPDTPQNQYWFDLDSDGFGDPAIDTYDCQEPVGYTDNNLDCDDSRDFVNPTEVEVCDALSLDEDCNGFANVNDPAMPKIDYWRDADNDGFGKGSQVTDCQQPDGYIDNELDCDDTESGINPSATEVCDPGNIDEDCDGDANADDSDLPTYAYWDDTDNDGYGDAGITTTDCAQPAGFADNPDDCDPGNGNVNPGAQEICNTIDDDCDSLIDTDDPSNDESQVGTFYEDSDGDGLGNSAVTQEVCDQPSGYVAVGGDCNDSDNSVLGPTPWFHDGDGDSYGDAGDSQQACTQPSGFVADNTDCDDSDGQERPGAKWYRDSDGDSFGDTTDSLTQCSRPNGYIATLGDCNDSDAAVNPNTSWLEDSDGDGYGNDAVSVVQCPQPVSHVLAGGDCNDTDAALNPATSWYRDSDGDTYGDASDSLIQCDQPTGYVLNPWDCDDTDASILPDAWWYPDTDGDGFGDASSGIQACSPPSGYVADDTDCDDARSSVNPGTRWYEDGDGDGFGSTVSYPTLQCAQPAGYVLTSSDCDDSDDEVNPDTVWYLDSDGDTFGNPDEAIAQCAPITGYVTNGWDCDDGDALIIPDTVWYFDYDGDGYGDSTNSVQACEALDGYALADGDCNDSDPFVLPGAADQCGDGVDTDCDGAGGPDDDEDGDSLTWTEEFGFSDPCEADTDGDTVNDGDEYGLDTDGDGQRDIQDTDDDGDGVPTAQEAGKDTDGDGVDDNLDTDDDGDGVLTLDEDLDGDGNPVNDDGDGDSIPAYLDFDEPNLPNIDSDGDGILDHIEDELGSDKYSDDSDGDGITDDVEVGDSGNPTDSDGDGTADLIDTDDDGDGVATADEGLGDSDGDGIADYLDLDSDNDGANDGVDPERTDPGGDDGPTPTPPSTVEYGFGCSSTGGSAGWLVLGLALLGVRRRL